MYHNLFSHSPTEGHLDYFQVLTILNKAAINIHVKIFVWTWVFNSFGWIPRSTISGLYDKSMLVFKKLTNYLPKWLYHFALPPATSKSYCSYTSSTAFGAVFQILVIKRLCFITSFSCLIAPGGPPAQYCIGKRSNQHSCSSAVSVGKQSFTAEHEVTGRVLLVVFCFLEALGVW